MLPKVIDIGVGRNPYFARFRTHCDAAEYVGVDSDEERLAWAQKVIDAPSRFRSPARKRLVKADAMRLPFDDQSFGLAVLSNVLSAPEHHKWDAYAADHTARGFGAKDRFYVERRKVVVEALRVLRPGGRLMIYTDLIIYGQHSYEMLIQELRDDPRLEFRVLEEEQRRVDILNAEKVRSGSECYCFLADLLPRCAVYEITRL